MWINRVVQQAVARRNESVRADEVAIFPTKCSESLSSFSFFASPFRSAAQHKSFFSSSYRSFSFSFSFFSRRRLRALLVHTTKCSSISCCASCW